jgi:hypothetical protein
MSMQLILSGVIEMYNPNFKYYAARMTSFRSTLVASDNGALWLTRSLPLSMKVRMLLAPVDVEIEINISCLGSSD